MASIARFVSLVVLALAAPLAAIAAPIATDNFEDSPVGPLNTLNGGTGFTGSWTASVVGNVVAFQTGYTNAAVVTSGGTNALEISEDGNPAAVRAIPVQSGDVLYFSCYFNTHTADGDPGLEFIQFGFTTNTTMGDADDVGVVHRNNNGDFRLGIRYGTGQAYYTPSGTETDRTYLVVFRMVKSTSGAGQPYNSLSLYIDPATTNEPAVADVTRTDARSAAYGYFGVRTANLQASDRYYIDNIRIGTSYVDVVQTEVSAETVVDAPVFAPPGGLFTNSITFDLTTATTGATIRYTTDASLPSSVNGTLYTGSVTLTASRLVKAIAYQEGKVDSAIAEARFGRLANPVAADEVEGYANGALNGQDGGQGWLTPYDAVSTLSVYSHPMQYMDDELWVRGAGQAVRIPQTASSVALDREFYRQDTNTLYLAYLFEMTADGGDLDGFLQVGFNTEKNTPALGVVHRSMKFAIRVGADDDLSTNVTTVGRVYLVVLKLSKGTPGVANPFTRADLFINPTTLVEPATATITKTGTFSSYFSHLTCRAASMEAGDAYAIDMIGISTTFAGALKLTPFAGTMVLLR